MAAEKLEKAVDEMNVAEQRFMCQFDTIEQLYFEKEKLYLEQMEKMRAHYFKIILAIAIPFIVFLSGIIGGAVYLLSNYDIGIQTYQEIHAEGGGDATNEDGIHFDRPPYGIGD